MSASVSGQYRPPLLWEPSGIQPNYVNPETRAPQARIIISTFAAAVFGFIVLRIYNRTVILRNWGLDDCECPNSVDRSCFASTPFPFLFPCSVRESRLRG
jgi:hypothetical protein